MAHYAKLDENNIVIEVNVVDNEQEDSLGGEEATVTWLKEGWGGIDWKKSSYNTLANQHPNGTPFRKNHAGINFTYDPNRDAFIPPQPWPSWLLDEEKCLWKAPVSYPVTLPGEVYRWDEETIQWIRVDETQA